MTPREKEIYISHVSYLIIVAILAYHIYRKTGVVAFSIDEPILTPYPTDLNYLKTVHDLQTKIREKETRRV